MASMLTQISPVLFGRGAVNELGNKIKELGGTKVLLMYDNGIKECGTGKRVEDIIKSAGLEVEVVDNVITEPPDYQIDEIYAANKDKGIDFIVGLGGGSCLDAAKGVAFMFTNKVDNINPYLVPSPMKASFPLIMVPTTSGTGSEASLVAVIADTKKNIKGGVLNDMTLSIVDPELAATMDPYLTAITGMDAFSHCAEAITANMHNPKSDALGAYGLKNIVKWLPVAVEDGSNMDAREALSIAATFGGMAFSDSFVNFGHAIAETIGAKCHASDGHIPHGLCCALAIPAVMEYVGDLCGDRIVYVADAIGVDYSDLGDDYPKIGLRVADAIRHLMHTVNIPSWKDKGVSREDIMAVVPDIQANMHNSACIAEITMEVAEKYTARTYDAYQ